MPDDASDSAVDRRSPAATMSTSAVTDRTATDVFASLAADGPTVDTDAILDGTSPDEIIDRTNDPEPSTSVHPSLYDEAEFTELLLPDRRSDGTFRWVETTDSASQPDTQPAGESATASIRTWQGTASDPDEPGAVTTADDTAMSDSPDARETDVSTTPSTDASGFERATRSKAGKVPPKTPAESENNDSNGIDADRSRSAPHSSASTPPTRETGSPSRDASTPAGSDTDDAATSEIRTTVQYFEGRNPDGASAGRLGAVKRVVSRLIRPGRSG